MKYFSRFVLPMTIGILTFAVLRFFNPIQEGAETANLRCDFAVGDNDPVSVPATGARIDNFVFAGDLTGKSIHEDMVLWHVEGLAVSRGTTWRLSGYVFLTLSNEVQAMTLAPAASLSASYSASQSLKIATLDETGRLRSNPSEAFVHFEVDTDKLAHPYNYRCDFFGEEN